MILEKRHLISIGKDSQDVWSTIFAEWVDNWGIGRGNGCYGLGLEIDIHR